MRSISLHRADGMSDVSRSGFDSWPGRDCPIQSGIPGILLFGTKHPGILVYISFLSPELMPVYSNQPSEGLVICVFVTFFVRYPMPKGPIGVAKGRVDSG